MGLSLFSKIWWPDMDFQCSKCGNYCDGEANSMVLADGIKMVHWCDKCGCLKEGRKDSFCDTNVESILLSLHPPRTHDLLLNPIVAKSYRDRDLYNNQ